MRLPNSAFIRLTEKFQNQKSMRCPKCWSDLIENDKPVYRESSTFSPGIMYTCECGKAKVWTNRLRSPKGFMDYLEKRGFNKTYYSNGFCNDLFCGFCFSTTIGAIIKNGWDGRSANLLGCQNPSCPSIVPATDVIVRGLIKDWTTDEYPSKWYKEKYIDTNTEPRYGNFVVARGRVFEYNDDCSPPELIEYYKKAIEKYGPQCIGLE